MTLQLTGIHHVTAIAGDPQKNVDFYVGPFSPGREGAGAGAGWDR